MSDPAGVLSAVAQALGVRDVDGELWGLVLERVGDRSMLLILDNFEQILPAATLVGELVAAAPSLRVIVTSQAPLRVSAETVVRVDPLRPEAAEELFLERAAASSGSPAVSDDERPVVAKICERIGGFPLAVELAAARMGVLSPADLLSRLEASSVLLRSTARDAPDRQRSLQATVEWTHTALTEAQQVLFRRLGVFAGPVPLSAIEAIAEQVADDPAPLDTLDALEGLVDFSLVHRDQSPGHGLRFSMPQALRDFAREKLAVAGDHDAVSRQHAEHIAALAVVTRVWMTAAPVERARLMALEAELGRALEWAVQHDHDLHQRLLAGLWMMLISRGRLRELNEHADAALEGEKAPTTPLSAWLGNLRAYQLGFAGHHAEAWAAIESVIAFARASNDKRELALALDTGALVHLELGETGAAIEAAQESLELVRHAGEPRLLAWALLTLAGTLIENERFAECERLLDEAAALAEGPASDVDLGIATMRADIAFGRNDHSHALELYASSLALAEQLGDSLQTVNDALAVVSLLSLRGHTDAALEADALLTAIAHDANYDGVTSARVMRQKALAAMGAPAATHAADAARRAAAIPASERVTQILALVRTVNQQDA